MKVITISNQKGGVAKTATAAALWAGFNMRGYKTLAIDLDPQRNLSDGAGADENKTIFGVMSREITAGEAIQTVDDMDLIASTQMLAAADSIFTETGKECILRESLEPLKDKYRYCIIDTPPTLNVLTVNALTASDSVIIPVYADVYSITGLTKLYLTMNAVKKYFNPSLTIEGILLARYKSNTNMSREITELLQDTAQQLDTVVFNAKIRDCVKVAEAPARRRNLLKEYPTATAAEDYNSLIDELLKGR
ncbi:MAG: AAA family ATPase [Acutalibacteraceae bacterium]|nr:AAA family ATPase [Acutalibacteraceae bacterium]